MREFDGPHFEPGLIGPDGRLTRWCKGGDNGAAIAEQKKARRQSQMQFAEQMKIAERQFEASQQIQTPEILPASPVPYQGMDTREAGRNSRRAARRRFGPGRTVYAGESGGGRMTPALGGAVALAA